MVEYVLRAPILVYCDNDDDDTGNTDECEIFGSIQINIGSLDVNQNLKLWRKHYTNFVKTMAGKSTAISTAMLYFYESVDFATSKRDLTISGTVRETQNDSGDGGYGIVNINDQTGDITVAAKDCFQNEKSKTFTQKKHEVEIRLLLDRVPNESAG